jgi:type II secretory pathway predicted ATPase ExeA
MKEDLDEHIDDLLDLMDAAPLDGKITLLTGSNGSGKSLIRKQMVLKISTKLGLEGKDRNCVASTSMELRTKSRPEFGGFSGIMRDTEWMPTSNQTLRQIKGLLETKDRYLVIDEPEIGMGEETVIALVNFFNKEFKKLDKSILGVMVITHNRYIVENLKIDKFLNTDGIETAQDWLDRELVPTDLDALGENKLFFAVRDRTNKVKEEQDEE